MTGAEFKAYRESLHLSQEAAATLFGVVRNTILNWESGKTTPPPVARYAFAAWDRMGETALQMELREAQRMQTVARRTSLQEPPG